MTDDMVLLLIAQVLLIVLVTYATYKIAVWFSK